MNSDVRSTGFGSSVRSVTDVGGRPPAGPAGAAPRLQAASVSPRMAGVRRKQTRVLGCNMADRRRMLVESVL